MARPVVGIISNIHVIGEQYEVQGTGVINLKAIAKVTDALPLMIPADPDLVDIDQVMQACDGFVFTGARPNVHPSFYGEDATEAHGDFDLRRDEFTLPLIRACAKRGQPILGICRGFQEFNVACGGSLHAEIRDLPGRMNHRMPPDGTMEEKFALRHTISLTKGGVFAGVFGADEVMVNSLHGQGVKDTGAEIVVEGHAPDGTPEAIYIANTPGFTLAVQWHPEWNAENDDVSRPLFESFGAALRAWRTRGENTKGLRIA